ncbi:PAS domain S-box protein [Desulfospira joergensenii]|uniref:PAS domain S-box protein n=1 Tax=Desulfospira joergensenii TaxID=53329 RepID=UPI0003B4C063|nr:PAS domain S-box protein [Desulfospira joergensenii]
MKYRLEELINIKQLQDIQDRLNELYAFPSSIIDNDGKILTATAWQDICAEFHRKNIASREICIKSDQYIKEHINEANPALTYHCPHGLVENAIPIIIEDIHYGNFFTGQFFLEKPDLAFFKEQARKYGFNEDAYIKAVKQVPIWSREKLENYLFFIKGLIKIIAESGLKKLKEIENRKNIERREEQHRSILETAMDGFWLTDVNGRLLEVNDSYCSMSGYTTDELLSMSIHDLEADKSHRFMPERLKKAGMEADRFESRHRRKDGTVYDIEISVQYRPGQGGRYIFFLRDISERKLAEASLKESEKRYRQIAGQIPGMLYQFVMHKDGTYSVPFVSEKVREFSGYRPEQIKKEPLLLFKPIHPDDLNHVQEEINNSAETLTEFNVEHRLIPPNGELKWFRVSSTPHRLSNGDILWNGISMDITRQKKAEEETQTREAVLNSIHSSAPVGIGLLDPDGTFHWPNKKLSEITGYSLKELEGLPTRELYLTEKEYNRVFEKKKKNLASRGYSSIETIWKQKKGTPVNVVLNSKFKDPTDPKQGIIGTALDITDQKTAEKKLQSQAETLDIIFNSAPNIMMLVDENGNTARINQKGIRFSGRDEKELIGLLGGEVINCVNAFKGEGCGRTTECLDCPIRTKVEATMETGESHTDEEGRMTFFQGGKKRSLALLISTKRLESDGIRQVLVSITDVTKLKQAEKALLKTREQYILAVKGSQDGIWDWDLRDNTLFLSARWKQIIGYRDHELSNTVSSLEDRLHPEDKPKFMDYVDQYLNGHNPVFAIEFRLRHKDGSYRWISSRGEALRDEKNRPYRMAGSHRDITEQKQKEQYYRMISEMLDIAPNSITIHDFGGRFLYANQKTFEIHGYEPHEFMAVNLHDLNAPESEALIQERMMIIEDTGETSFTSTHFRKDGTPIPMEVFVKKVAWENKPALLSVATDITERLNADKELKESQSNLTSLIENTDDIMVSRDKNGRALVYNQAFARVVKRIFKVDPTPGIRTLDYLPKDQKAHWEEVLLQVLSGVSLQEEFCWEIDGEQHIYETSHNPMKVGDQVIGTVEFTRDITRRKLAEKKFQDMAKRLDLATRGTGLGIWDWDIKARKLTWDERMYQLYGVKKETFSNAYEVWRNGLHPEDREENDRITEAAGRGEREYDTEFRIIWPDGTIRFIRALGRVIWDSKGQPARMIGINYDITEKKEMEARVQQSQKMEAIGNLAGGIAHDFNNILFPIIGMSEMLLEDFAPETMEHENAREIFKAGKRGSDLVKQILAFSRQSEHKMIPVRVQQILREVLKLTRATIPSDIEIHQDIQSDCGLIMADPTQIHQVAMNIITNAFHAVESKGGAIFIKLKETGMDGNDLPQNSHEPGRYARLSISDTGMGIPPEIIGKIFEPYFTTKEKGKGTGLGLAVAYGIVKEHKGYIQVDTNPAKGTKFQIFFPLMSRPADKTSKKEPEKYPRGSEKILLVDDESSIANLEKQMLEKMGYTVTTRISSLDALDAFKAKPDAYDLVLTDMNMPNMTGEQLARELKTIRHDIPVIICTGFSERIDKAKAKSIGINGFLMKPVVKTKMAKMVRITLDEAKTDS